ncbi:MBL fold metallo-hydrolase [Litoreibacter roseus]|uniref:Zn-dependent hydrolase n=1 Tax=Litoreibacter roseus TaxID=2601869 RepID=A0A6N6JGR2_9RHOB|nr:MBL fold metallo-hydrolase [Litoreibacter roseus]GFE65305.1 Zn-dependent hydrolase [Litoreibacter roseus]
MIRFIAVFLLLVVAAPSAAQDRRPSHCIALVENEPGFTYLHQASWQAPLEANTIRLSYVDHATFILQTEGGLSVATDYTGFLGVVDFVPTVATMNHAHSSHWTTRPDPRIPHVLPGWNDAGGPVDHHLDLGEMLVRNVPTDIRSRYGAGIEEDGNSIFVFEVAGLCIGHLGHLHHEPDAAQYAALGRLDVVMAAVDGGLTLDLPTMMRVLNRLKSSVVIPMHWFAQSSLERFLGGMSDDFNIVRTGESSMTVSLRTLPSEPTIMVLQPAYLREPEE